MPESRKQILFVSHRIPFPPNRGDRIRSYHLIKFLAERADVHLAFLTEEEVPPQTQFALENICARVTFARLPRYGRWFNAAMSLATGKTATEGLFKSRRLGNAIEAWCKETHFDAVVAFCSSSVQYFEIDALRDTPSFVDLVDVDSQKWFDYAVHAKALKRALYSWEGRRLRNLESALPDRARAVTLVSRAEAELFRSFRPSDAVHAIANGVDLEYFDPRAYDTTPPKADYHSTCVFVGALDYQANIDGARWFCEQVWPQFRRRHPNATFSLVGSNPGAAANRLGQVDGVNLIGPVPDVRPYLAGAQIVVAPLRVARGLQNKVIEALAMRKAVIASPQAAEGLSVESGIHLQISAQPEQWLDALSALVYDNERRRSLGQAGRSYAEEHHRWDVQLAPLASLLGLQESPHTSNSMGKSGRLAPLPAVLV